MPSTKDTVGGHTGAQSGDIPNWRSAAMIDLHAEANRDAEATQSASDGWNAFHARGRCREDIERLGYWRPAEADLVRRYAGRGYADDPRAERDRCIGPRAMPTPNFGGSLTGNAAAMCCGA